MGSIPSGTVSFLFTDIAGSTTLWETDRLGMQASLMDHDRILRSAIEANNGVVFATGGDSFSAAFHTTLEAVQAAVAAQFALETHPWSGPRITVRMGIHSGVADERDANYFGPEVTRAARIMALGHGRQTLLSETAAGLARDLLPDPIALTDLGVHDLKDIGRAEHIFEVRHPDLPEVTTPLTSVAFAGAHLPVQLTSFVGRAAELAAISELIEASRVVTLTGVGGTGKTRLAIEVAEAKAVTFDDGAWMAGLASVTDADLVLTRIAEVWGLRPGEGANLHKVVTTFLSRRELLLVVDNCEHVLETVSKLLMELLPVCPGLKVLATSRESLGIPGEAVYRVPSMGLPANGALHSDAVALFLDRFKAIRPDYAPTDQDLAAIILVCRRLDGIPLGLELAAARLRSMSPTELADRLNESFRILTGSSKTALPRQRTLQATIDWSYDLLEPTERRLFRLVSCFIGGFDLEAATVVAKGIGLEDWGVIDVIDQLVDKSLLTLDASEAASRYQMLEPIRQYAQEKLADEGESETAHAAHAGYYARIVHEIAPSLRTAGQLEAHRRLRLEVDNIRSSLAELRDSGRVDDFLLMCFDLGMFWSEASMQIEGLEVLHSVLDANPDADRRLLAKAWWVACLLAFNLSDPISVEYGLKGIEVAEKAGDDTAVGWVSLMTAMAIAGTTVRSDALDYFTRGLELIEAGPDRVWWDTDQDRMFKVWARVFLGPDSPEAMYEIIDRAVDLARENGDRFTLAGAMTGAYFHRSGDDDARALAYLEEAVRVLDGLGYRHLQGHTLIYWGWMTRDRLGDGVGEDALGEGARMLAEIGDLPCAVNHTTELISHLSRAGRVDESAPHLAFVSHQARADAMRFARRVADAACHAAVAAGDLEMAAMVLGFRGPHSRTDSVAECRAAIESGLHPDEMSMLMSKGSRLGEIAVLELIESWAPSLGGESRTEPGVTPG